MSNGLLDEALQREHREIDAGLELFVAGLAEGETRTEPLMKATEALRRHIYLEEELLFPSLRGGMVAPVFVMLRDHGQIWKAMDALEAQLGAGADGASLQAACKELAAALEAHNLKEEQIVYSQADGALTPAESETLATFLASGKMPEGWVCTRARA